MDILVITSLTNVQDRNSQFSQRSVIRRKLHLFVFRLRTFKHKKSPSFCIYTEKNIHKTLRQLHLKTYHLSSRIISLSGDVELNPGPASEPLRCSIAVYQNILIGCYWVDN